MNKLLHYSLPLLFICAVSRAGVISHNDYTAGNVITAAGQNTNENTIVNEFNGNIDNANIKTTAAIAVTKLQAGSNNTVLITNGSGVEVYSSTPVVSSMTVTTALNVPAGFGRISQIVSSATTTTLTYNGTANSFANTALGLTITPLSAGATIYIFATGTLRGGNAAKAQAGICRNAANLATQLTLDGQTSATNIEVPATLIQKDSPNSTSAVNYAVCVTRTTGNDTIDWNKSGVSSTIIAVEVD